MGLDQSYMDDLNRIADGFISLTNRQQEGARNLPRQLWAYNQEDFIRASLGMFVELGELVNECRWKPWRRYEGEPTDLERAKVLKEFGDVLHMLAWTLNNLRERFDIGPAEIAAAFIHSHLENVARFRGEVPGREPPPPMDPSVGVPRRPDRGLPDPKLQIISTVGQMVGGPVAEVVQQFVIGELTADQAIEALNRVG